MRGYCALTLCTVLLLSPSQNAAAQDNATGSQTSAQRVVRDEIIVSARRREESLQQIPLTISAFSADDINRAGIQDLEDISFKTPGLAFNTNLGTLYPGREGSSIRFRGIGDAEGAEITKLQPTSVFIDGAFVLNGAQSIGLVDIERIEVIKGPQSALFGRNSFAGAINYITRNPDLEQFRGSVVAEAATYDQYDVYASIEGPIIQDRLSGLVSIRGYNKGSMYTASDGGDLGEESSKSISGVLFAQPVDNFSAKLRVFYQEDDDGPAASGFIPGRLADTCTGTSRAGLDDAGNPVTLMPSQFICGTVPERSGLPFDPIDSNTSLRPQTFLTSDPDFLIDNLLNDPRIDGVPQLDGFSLRRDIFRIGLTMDYEFANGITVALLGSYNKNDAAVLRDLDLTSVESWYQYNARSGEDKSIDIQIASPDDGRFRWLGGLNYYEQEFLTSATGGSFVAACLAGFCDAGPLFLPLGNDGGDDAKVFSIYTSLSFDITDQLTVGFEGRFQKDERSDGVSNLTQEVEKFLPRVTLSYEPTDDLTLYASWSQGFLPGLVNGVIINCSEQGFTTPFISPITGLPSTSSECDQMREQLGASFKDFTEEQTLDAYEIGFKSQWFDGRLLINAAAYYYDWSNQPSTNFITVFRDDDMDGVPNTTLNALQVASAGSSKSYGVELEGSLLIMDGWRIDGTLSYNDNEYTDYLGLVTFARANGGSRNFEGNRAPRFAEWSGSLSSTYQQAAIAGWEWYVRGDLVFQGETFTGSENLATIDSFVLADARVGIERDNVRVELFVKNLTDQDKWRGGLSFFDVADIQGTFDFNNLGVTVVPQDRRTFGVRTAFSF